MNITVTKNQVSVDTNYILNDKEYNINQCNFTFSDEYTNDLVKKAIFVQGTSTIEVPILNNQCQIPEEVLNNGQFQIRVYAYETEGDELVLRYSPSYATAYVRTGSYIENAESPEVITPTQFEQYVQAMNDGLNEINSNMANVLEDLNVLRQITPSDLIWIQGYTRYLGNLNASSNYTSSQCFKVLKGSSITCSNTSVKVRYTTYGLDGAYIGDSGTFRNIPTYDINSDCYFAISYEGSLSSEIINAFSLKIIKENNIDINFNFYAGYSTRFESNTIFLQKGDVIRTTDSFKYRQNGEAATPAGFIGYNLYGLDKITHNYKNMGQNSNYVSTEIEIEEDSYLRLYVRLVGDRTLQESDLPKLNNLIEIKKKENLENNFIQDSLYRTYIGNNGKSEIIEYTGGNILYRLLRPADEIIIKKGNATLNYISFTNLLAQFPNKQQVYNDKTYLKLANYEALYLDLFDNTFKINNLNSTLIGNQNVLLLANAWGNVLNSELLILYLKGLSGAENIFNSGDYITSSPWIAKSKTFSSLLNTTSQDIETYTFFTDAHLMGYGSDDYSTNLQKFVGTMQKVYNSTPMNFIVDGGDWLNNGDTPANACFKLGYVDGFMNSMFHDYHVLVGNHDTNSQGTEAITQTTLNNLWYRNTEKAYYKFNGKKSMNYCLDTGEVSNTMNTYRWTQVDWLANELLSDNPTHATIFMHIVWNNDTVQAFADNVTKLINAFNNKTTITLNSITYDFASVTGHIDYVMSGHTHSDKSATVNGVLCIGTTTFGYNVSTPTFDMVLNDYGTGKVYLTRFGNGSDRVFDI